MDSLFFCRNWTPPQIPTDETKCRPRNKDSHLSDKLFSGVSHWTGSEEGNVLFDYMSKIEHYGAKKKKKLVAVSFTQLTNGYQINKSTCISAIRQPGWIWLDHNKFLFDQDETTVNQIVLHFSISWLFLMMLSPSYDHRVYLPASINCCFIVWGELSCEKYYRNWTYYLFISVFLLWLPL